ncbi:hypothetical protein [Cerasibacillus terrae]|uniref:hypothetical protein n=1 Tax=Cerasibacillus terrae TaxID=2498845 RepID=UPI000A993643|nr:hypothetical protein [Cerasibacillus terrae]
MNLKKLSLGAFTVILSTGLLFGCADEDQDSEPTNEEPTEEQQENESDEEKEE